MLRRTLFCCEAPEMFCGLQNLTRISIDKEASKLQTDLWVLLGNKFKFKCEKPWFHVIIFIFPQWHFNCEAAKNFRKRKHLFSALTKTQMKLYLTPHPPPPPQTQHTPPPPTPSAPPPPPPKKKKKKKKRISLPLSGRRPPAVKPPPLSSFYLQTSRKLSPTLPFTPSGVRLKATGIPAWLLPVCQLCSVTACTKPISKANLAILPSSKRKRGHKKKAQTHTPMERD